MQSDVQCEKLPLTGHSYGERSDTAVAVQQKRLNSRQIAAIIETNIAHGEFAYGERLKSTRLLAEEYGVGQRVIIYALDILERKKLVARKERYGVYVKHPSRKPWVREIMILALGGTPADQRYVKFVSEFMHFQAVSEKYDFFTRYIPGKDAHLRFSAELERLEKFGYPDCVLLVGLDFKQNEVEQALLLPYPVLFLGNFLEGDYPDLNYNRLGGTHDTALKTCLAYAAERRYRKVDYLTSHVHQERMIFREAIAEATAFAKQHGLKFRHRPVMENPGELPELYSSLLNVDKRNGELADLALITGGDKHKFLEFLNVEGIRYPEDLDLISLDSVEDTPPFRHLKRDLDLYYWEIDRAIDRICSGRNKMYGIRDIDIVTGLTGE